jgi:hypothetical protein
LAGEMTLFRVCPDQDARALLMRQKHLGGTEKWEESGKT